VTNLRTGPKGSEWKKKSEGRNSVRRTGSSGGSSWRSWRRDSSLDGMSLANLAAFRRLASFSREVAAMDMVFPTMALRLVWENLHGNRERGDHCGLFVLGFGGIRGRRGV